MKLFILTTNGRSGSDFFHSLVDNHPQIASFPGHIDISKLKKIFEQERDIQNFLNKFLKNYDLFFDSRKNKIENHHLLGKMKNQFYKVDKKKFLYNFNLLNKKNINFKKILINLHLAYNYTLRKKNKKIKLIFLHAHHYKNLKKIGNFKFENIYSYRHPISIISSGINAFMNSKKNLIYTSKSLYFYIERTLVEPFFVDTNYKINLVRLETLHTENSNFMRKICKLMDIKFNKSLVNSTFNGKQWWGDSLSNKKKYNFNTKFKVNFNSFHFDKKDFFLIQKILAEPMKRCGYKKINFSKMSIINIFFPLKIEKIFFKRIIKERKVKELIKFFYFYPKRVLLFIKLFNYYAKNKINII